MKTSIDRPIKILHITACRELTSGQRNQLKFEHKASKLLADAEWSLLAFHTGEIVESFERKIPFFLRPLFLRNLFVWFAVLKNSVNYDVVLMRHLLFDPFCFIFTRLIKNRISVHHSKEVEEILVVRNGLSGKLASALEKITGRYVVKHSIGILGVTDEIARYEQKNRAPNVSCFVYPNGINIDEIEIAEDLRDTSIVNAIFICGTFSSWHGLDKLISAIELSDFTPGSLKIYLVGKLFDSQIEKIKALRVDKQVFKICGYLSLTEYTEIISHSDFGISSLALERKNLVEASTLKVRELLAFGLPIFSGHIDKSFPDDFQFYFYDKNVSIESLLKFGLEMKKVKRDVVRNSSIKYISKENSMKNVVRWIRSLNVVIEK